MKKIKLIPIDNLIRLLTIASLIAFNMIIGNIVERINLLHVLVSMLVCTVVYTWIENGLNASSHKVISSTLDKDEINIDIPIE